MRVPQSGTSVLASLVFVALFVLIISSYKLITPPEFASQSAAVLSAVDEGIEISDIPDQCIAGDVHTINVEGDHASVSLLRCYAPDPMNPDRRVPGPDVLKPGCTYADAGVCTVRYCPPSSMVTQSGMCIRLETCEPGMESACLRGAVQNAMRPEQAGNILAAILLADKGSTQAQRAKDSASLPLASLLTPSGNDQVSAVIESTAQAAAAQYNADDLWQVAQYIKESGMTSGVKPSAQISCQPKNADPGMKVSIAFGCANAQQSASKGFSTGGRLWGATEEIVSASSSNGTLSYSLTCTNGRNVDVAACEVSVFKPFILMTSDLSPDGTQSSLSWITRGVNSCTMMTDNPKYESVMPLAPGSVGVVRFPAPGIDTRVAMECVTSAGNIKRTEILLAKKTQMPI